MSRVTFHSPSGYADLCGAERAHAGVLVTDLALLAFGSLSEYGDHRHPIRRLIPSSHYMSTADLAISLSAAIGCGGLTFDLGDGETVDSFTMSLNTAMRLGSNPVKLLARLHAQCEIHGWIDGPNREWLAGMVEDGRESGILRGEPSLRDWGTWEGVVDFLRSADDEPVVMSYSVCDGFPNRGIAQNAGLWTPTTEDGDEWYDLPEETQWALAMQALRLGKPLMEWTPGTWDDYTFGSGISAFELMEIATSMESA